MPFELVNSEQGAVIKVIGVGGGGGNAIEHMLAASIEGVEFIVANTDAQALERSNASKLIRLGASVTRGLGAGSNPEVGARAALEDKDLLAEHLDGADMLFITAGMGGGTGTGAAPVIAQVAKELGILTVAVVTRPFSFELRRRHQVADQGIAELARHVDSLIIIPNDKIRTEIDPRTPLRDAYRMANGVLQGAVQGIAELITRTGLMNLDFADVRAAMGEMGMAMMGSYSAQGEARARVAAEGAVTSPFLEDVNIAGARGILVNITAADISLDEFGQVGSVIEEIASPEALVKIGAVFDSSLGDALRVTVVATGLSNAQLGRSTPAERVPELKVVTPARAAAPDYRELDRPTVMRNARRGDPLQPFRESDLEYLEVPAFLRRQAD
jgi:cell division protein FtsZ